MTSGWQILTCGAVSAAGTLMFLRLVADEIRSTTAELQRADEAALKEYRREMERQRTAGSPVEVVVASRSSRRDGQSDG